MQDWNSTKIQEYISEYDVMFTVHYSTNMSSIMSG